MTTAIEESQLKLIKRQTESIESQTILMKEMLAEFKNISSAINELSSNYSIVHHNSMES